MRKRRRTNLAGLWPLTGRMRSCSTTSCVSESSPSGKLTLKYNPFADCTVPSHQLSVPHSSSMNSTSTFSPAWGVNCATSRSLLAAGHARTRAASTQVVSSSFWYLHTHAGAVVGECKSCLRKDTTPARRQARARGHHSLCPAGTDSAPLSCALPTPTTHLTWIFWPDSSMSNRCAVK